MTLCPTSTVCCSAVLMPCCEPVTHTSLSTTLYNTIQTRHQRERNTSVDVYAHGRSMCTPVQLTGVDVCAGTTRGGRCVRLYSSRGVDVKDLVVIAYRAAD